MQTFATFGKALIDTTIKLYSNSLVIYLLLYRYF